MYYPIGEEWDLAFYVGMLLYKMRYYTSALELLSHSLRLYGENPTTLHNMALCLMIENIMRHLPERRKERRGGPGPEEIRQVILRSGHEVLRPIFFAIGSIIIVYLPILTLQGVEGKMFRPMALTVISALVAALILAFTVAPVFVSLFLRREVQEEDTAIVRWAKRLYQPILFKTLQHPAITAVSAAVICAASLGLASLLGAKFIAKLDEGAIALQAWRFTSVWR